MYKLIGADGKEYGPVTGEQLRQWVADGRANGQTLVQAAGQADWKRLEDWPELAGALIALASQAPPPFTAPPGLANELLARDYTVKAGHCLSRGWDLVMRHFGLTVGTSAVVLLLIIVTAIIPFASLLLAFVIAGGLDWLLLKLIRGEPARFGDIWAGFKLAFVPLLLVSIVAGVLIQVGILLCVLPGLYAMVVWAMFPPLLILDKKLEFWPAMETSRKMIHKHFGQILWLFVVTMVVFFLGFLLLGVGVFFTMPLTSAACVYAYEDMFGPSSQTNAHTSRS